MLEVGGGMGVVRRFVRTTPGKIGKVSPEHVPK